MGAAEDIGEGLARWLADELGDPAVKIENLARTSVGFSRENWVFDAVWHENGQSRSGRFIARRDPAGSVLDTDRRVEGAVLKSLEGTAVPVPPALGALLSM